MSSYQDDVVLSELQLHSAVAVHQETRFHFYNTQVESVFTSNIDSEMINSSNTNNTPLLSTNSCVDTETVIDLNDVDVHRRPRIRYAQRPDQINRTPAKAEVITSNSELMRRVTDLGSVKTISHPLLFDSADCASKMQYKDVNDTSLLIHHIGATPLHSVGLQSNKMEAQVWRGALLLTDYVLWMAKQRFIWLQDSLGDLEPFEGLKIDCPSWERALWCRSLTDNAFEALELGAGCALVSIAAARCSHLFSRITATDYDTSILQNAQHNVSENLSVAQQSRVRVCKLDLLTPPTGVFMQTNSTNIAHVELGFPVSVLDWSPADTSHVRRNVRVLFGADIIYDDGITDALVNFVAHFLTMSIDSDSVGTLDSGPDKPPLIETGDSQSSTYGTSSQHIVASPATANILLSTTNDYTVHRIAYFAVERRYVFTNIHRRVCVPALDHFLKQLAQHENLCYSWIPCASIPQAVEYERCSELALLRVWAVR